MVQKGLKWENLNIVDHLVPSWADLVPYGPFQTKTQSAAWPKCFEAENQLMSEIVRKGLTWSQEVEKVRLIIWDHLYHLDHFDKSGMLDYFYGLL